jgi:hypothetical protein
MQEWQFEIAISADILRAKSIRLSKGTIPRAVASVAVAWIVPETRISKVSTSTGGVKGGERHSGYKTMPGAKATPSTKKSIILVIGALAALSLNGTKESSSHDQAPKVQSKVDPWGPSVEPQARSTTKSGLRPAPEVSLRIVPTTGVDGASIGCF